MLIYFVWLPEVTIARVKHLNFDTDTDSYSTTRASTPEHLAMIHCKLIQNDDQHFHFICPAELNISM